MLRVPPQLARHLRQLRSQLLLQRRAVLQQRRCGFGVASCAARPGCRGRPIWLQKGAIRLIGRTEKQVDVRRGCGCDCGDFRILSVEMTGRDV